ncbi:MAG: hypothetical protein N2712_02805 [Brevinematales bacterium]|nr:hypothetical protein [Brevinematales bacterium]
MFRNFLIFLCIFSLLFFSSSYLKAQKKMPDWISIPTFKKGKDFYFVGMGISKDIVSARNLAIEDIKSKVVQSILVDVTAETKGETVISSQSGEIDVTQNIRNEVTVKGKARIFVPAPDEEVSYQDKDGSYVVYLLVKFPESKILEERQRIEQMYKDMIRSVDKFIEEGDMFVREGKLLNAIASYTLAAKNSVNVEERKMFYPEIIKKIDDIISRLSIEVVEGSNKKVGVGDKGEIKFRVFYNSEGKKVPIRDANVIFRVSSGGAEVSTSATSDENGFVTCNVFRVLRFDNKKLSIKAFLNLDFTSLASISRETKQDAAKLITKGRLVQSEANWYMSETKAKNAVIISLKDKDNSGYLYDSTLSSSLSSYVMKKGYKVSKPTSTSINSDDVQKIRKFVAKDAVIVLVKVSEPKQKVIDFGNEKINRVEYEISVEVYDEEGNLINSLSKNLSSSSLSAMNSNLPTNIGEVIEEMEF